MTEANQLCHTHQVRYSIPMQTSLPISKVMPTAVMSSASSDPLNKVTGKADRLGIAGSLLCAVHCALMPLMLSVLPALGVGLTGTVDWDQTFVVFATLLGVATLSLGYRRHRAHHAWMLLLPGLVMVWLGSFTSLHDHSSGHAVMMTCGGLMIAAAHFINLRLNHRADRIGLKSQGDAELA